MKAKKESSEENRYIDELLEKASKNSKVEIPDEIINDEINRMLGEFSQNLKMQGIDFEQYLKLTNLTDEKIKEDMKPEATKRVQYRLLLDAIIKEEKIEIEEHEVEEEGKKLAARYNMPYEEFLSAFGGLEMIKYDRKIKKAIEILKENN